MLNNAIAAEQQLQQIHQTCFEPSVFSRRQLQFLKPVSNAVTDGGQSDKLLPTVSCCVSQDEATGLDVTFVIQNHSQCICPPIFDSTQARHTDFLWENNCFELFISSKQSDYYEINMSLSGEFAIYYFDDYRSPNILPPRVTNDLTFQWCNTKVDEQLIYQFSVLFSPAKFEIDDIQAINPTAILYKDREPIYYAVHHANPPDFHDKKNWLDF